MSTDDKTVETSRWSVRQLMAIIAAQRFAVGESIFSGWAIYEAFEPYVDADYKRAIIESFKAGDFGKVYVLPHHIPAANDYYPGEEGQSAVFNTACLVVTVISAAIEFDGNRQGSIPILQDDMLHMILWKHCDRAFFDEVCHHELLALVTQTANRVTSKTLMDRAGLKLHGHAFTHKDALFIRFAESPHHPYEGVVAVSRNVDSGRLVEVVSNPFFFNNKYMLERYPDEVTWGGEYVVHTVFPPDENRWIVRLKDLAPVPDKD